VSASTRLAKKRNLFRRKTLTIPVRVFLFVLEKSFPFNVRKCYSKSEWPLDEEEAEEKTVWETAPHE